MATKAEMVTFILENSIEYSEDYLNELSYKKVKLVYDETEIIVPSELIDKVIFGDNLSEDKDEEDLDKLENIIEKEEVGEVWNYENLSPNDQRLYRRTGIKRISKSKKYTRFDKEEPKI